MLTSGNVYSSYSAPPHPNPSPSFFPSSLFNATSSSCIVAHDHPNHLNGGYRQSDFLEVQPVTQDPLTSNSSVLQQNTMISPNYKKQLKKDRRTKISTARGMRDRRVRLSMEIARKFFDLQDMLGFDKASKTLGWLLAESKTAINELVSVKGRSTITSPFVCKEDNNLAAEKRSIRKSRSSSNSTGTRSSSSGSNKVPTKKVRMIPNQDALEAKKRRTKARERARERTMDKEIIKIMSNKLDQPLAQDIQLMKSLPFNLTSDQIPFPESSHLGFVQSYSGFDTSQLSTNGQVDIDANRNQQHMMSFDSGSCDSNMIVKTLNCAYYYSIADLQDVNHGSDNMRSDSSFLSNSSWATNAEDLQHMSSSYLPLNVARL